MSFADEMGFNLLKEQVHLHGDGNIVTPCFFSRPECGSVQGFILFYPDIMARIRKMSATICLQCTFLSLDATTVYFTHWTFKGATCVKSQQKHSAIININGVSTSPLTFCCNTKIYFSRCCPDWPTLYQDWSRNFSGIVTKDFLFEITLIITLLLHFLPPHPSSSVLQYSAPYGLLPSLYSQLQCPAGLSCSSCCDGILLSSSSPSSAACGLCPLPCLSEPPGPTWVRL